MKKIFKRILALPMLALAMSCGQEEIVFDHELPAFETKEGSILLEVIVPTTTKDDDVIYIAGEFNGGDEAAAEDITWQLEKSTTVDRKWGIYLNPSTFKDGKTLADGYHFVSVREGEERSALNEAVVRTENPAPGTRTNIYVSHWNMYFYVAPEIEHDGPVIYVNDQTGWEALAMYAWGDAEAFGGWPGMQPTGTEEVNGVTYKYFDCGEANRGLNLNLIFNNNGGGTQLKDYNITLEEDEYFLVITEDGVQTDDALPVHEGFIRVYVDNQAGWEAVALYQWGDVNNLGGDWPGMQPTGTATIAGYEYTYFDYAVSDVAGLGQNLIFNNNGGGIQTADQAVTFSEEVLDHFYVISGEKDCAVIADPFNRDAASDDEEKEEPVAPAVRIYVDDQTGWDAIALYQWGDVNNLGGGWPGALPAGTATIEEIEYKYFDFTEEAKGLSQNLIFNNNGGGVQLADYAMTFEEAEYYLLVTSSSVSIVDPMNREKPGEEFMASISAHTFESNASNPAAISLSAKGTSWTVETDKEWVYVTDLSGETVTSGEGSNAFINLKVVADPNFETSSREAIVTFKTADGAQTAEINVTQKAAGAAYLSQWVFQDSTLDSYKDLWPSKHILPATTGGAAWITVVRGDNNADVPFNCTVKGKNPNVSTMVEDDYWLFTFNVSDVAAGTAIEFNATMAGDAKSPKYWIVEYYDGGEWKAVEEDLKTAPENSSIKYTYKCSGDVSTGSGAADSYQYTTVMQTIRFENAIVNDALKIRCRAVGNLTCDGSIQDINATSSSASSMPDFGFTAANVNELGTIVPQDKKKVLVLGNSFSYYFNPMFMLKQIAYSQGHELKINAHLKGSQRFSNHLTLSMSQDYIKEGGYDYAIIQDQSTNPAKYAKDPEANAVVMESCTSLVEQIRQYSPNCKIILVQTWAFPASDFGGYGSYETFDEYLTIGTRQMAEAANVAIAPVGQAFAQTRADKSWSLYYSGDDKHPTRSSAYLEACVEYQVMFGEEFDSNVPDLLVNSSRTAYFKTLAEDLIIGHEADYMIGR